MEKKIKKRMLLTMGTRNGIISTAMLSLLFEKKQKDNLELLRSFVECAVYKKYEIGEKIDVSIIAHHMESEFGFESVVDSVVETILQRMAKDKYISVDHHCYYYSKSLEDKYEKFTTKKDRANQLLVTITENLKNVFRENKLKEVTDEEVHNILYEYFEEYGLSLFNKKVPNINSNNKNPYLYSLASYVIEQEKNNSQEFVEIVQLYKGVVLSSIIYLQPENAELYYARFKNTTVYLDAPIVLRILGLCSDIENRRGKQFFDLLRGKVSFKLYQHSFHELCSIINAYKKNRHLRWKSNYTLQYFDKQKVSNIEITNYYTALPQTLANLGIIVEDPFISEADKSGEEYTFLRSKLKTTISFYEEHESALEYDTASIISTRIARSDRVVTAIENCGAIFATMNNDLASIALAWQNDEMSSVPLLISDIDLSVIMWLKEYRSKQDFPKDFIVSNAFGTLEAISDSFMEQLSQKVVKMQQNGILSPADVSLVSENIYIQHKLLETSMGDIEQITEGHILEERDKYKTEYAKEIGMDNEKLSREKREAEIKLEEMDRTREKSYSAMISTFQKQAKEYAISTTKWVPIFKWIGIVLFFILAVSIAVVEIVLTGFSNGLITTLLIISALFSIYGIMDTIIPAMKFIDKLRNKLISNKYADKFSALLKNYENEINN